MNKFFDCCNVRSYGEGMHKRNEFIALYRSPDDTRFTSLLNTFLEYFHGWKKNIHNRPGKYTATAHAKMFISQQTYEGLQITTHSTVEIVKFLLSKGLNSVLTERFQQDPLEEYFGNQRQRGRRADNLDALQFGYNDRALDVQQNIVPIKSGNVGGRNLKTKSNWVDIINKPLPKRTLKQKQK